MDILYLNLLLAAMFVAAESFMVDKTEQKCARERYKGMPGAYCAGINLEEIPQTLGTDIEILDATTNRIRSIKSSSLAKYTSLKFLYLKDNFITKIDADALSQLSDLEVLDLSKNSIRILPVDLPLPLRIVYLTENTELQNISLSQAYNLAFLSLADCGLKTVPEVGILPSLESLNLTHNPLINVTPADLAPMCRLKTLYLPKTLYKQKTPQVRCQCHRLLIWTTQRFINLPDFNCTGLENAEPSECDVDMSKELEVYEACRVISIPTRARSIVMAVVAGCVLIAFIVIICWWRKSRRKKNSVQDQKRTMDKNQSSRKAADTLIS